MESLQISPFAIGKSTSIIALQRVKSKANHIKTCMLDIRILWRISSGINWCHVRIDRKGFANPNNFNYAFLSHIVLCLLGKSRPNMWIFGLSSHLGYHLRGGGRNLRINPLVIKPVWSLMTIPAFGNLVCMPISENNSVRETQGVVVA